MKDDVSHMNVLGRPVLHAVGISKQIPVMPEPEYVAVTDLKIYRAFVFRVNVTHQIHNAGIVFDMSLQRKIYLFVFTTKP